MYRGEAIRLPRRSLRGIRHRKRLVALFFRGRPPPPPPYCLFPSLKGVAEGQRDGGNNTAIGSQFVSREPLPPAPIHPSSIDLLSPSSTISPKIRSLDWAGPDPPPPPPPLP